MWEVATAPAAVGTLFFCTAQYICSQSSWRTGFSLLFTLTGQICFPFPYSSGAVYCSVVLIPKNLGIRINWELIENWFFIVKNRVFFSIPWPRMAKRSDSRIPGVGIDPVLVYCPGWRREGGLSDKCQCRIKRNGTLNFWPPSLAARDNSRQSRKITKYSSCTFSRHGRWVQRVDIAWITLYADIFYLICCATVSGAGKVLQRKWGQNFVALWWVVLNQSFQRWKHSYGFKLVNM